MERVEEREGGWRFRFAFISTGPWPMGWHYPHSGLAYQFQSPLETPFQTHPEACFTNFLDVTLANQVDNQDSSAQVPW